MSFGHPVSLRSQEFFFLGGGEKLQVASAPHMVTVANKGL